MGKGNCDKNKCECYKRAGYEIKWCNLSTTNECFKWLIGSWEERNRPKIDFLLENWI